jgi:predicted Zn-dependent peptidase
MHEVINTNGAQFIFSPFKNTQTASLGIFIKNGARFEGKKIKGAAHFLEHLIFKGSKKYSCKKIKQEIEGRGGSLNGFTSQEITGYYAHFLNKNAELVADILSDMVASPLIKEKDVEKERKVILEEIKMYNDLPASRSSALLDKLLWPGHPLGEEIAGSLESVKKISHRDLCRYQQDFYTPEEMVISLSGDVLPQKIIKVFSSSMKKNKTDEAFVSRPPYPLTGVWTVIEKKPIEQTHLAIGFRGPSYLSKERITVEVMNIILGGNMSSRLFEQLRERKPVCYDVSSEMKKYRDTGALVIHVGLDKTQVMAALGSILRELKKISTDKVSAAELSRAKDFFIGQLTMALERPQGFMFYAAESFIQNKKIETPQALKKQIESVTFDDILICARKIFDLKNICIACVGDVEKTHEEKIRALCAKV